MPDKLGFDHLPHMGSLYHRCIECGWPERDTFVSEADRTRHHKRHLRERNREAEATRQKNLAKARKAAEQKRRENDLAYRQEGDA